MNSGGNSGNSGGNSGKTFRDCSRQNNGPQWMIKFEFPEPISLLSCMAKSS